MFPLCSDRKLDVHELRLKLHIIYEEHVFCARQEVWRIIYCHNLLILKPNFCLVAPNSFKALTLCGNYVTDSGNNLQTSILACAKVSFKNLTKSLGLVLPW